MTESSNFAADLATALARITGQAAITCEFAVPGADANGDPVDRASLNVDYYRAGATADHDALFRDDTLACDAGADGWQYTSADQTKIRLCGSVCDSVKASVGCASRIR